MWGKTAITNDLFISLFQKNRIWNGKKTSQLEKIAEFQKWNFILCDPWFLNPCQRHTDCFYIFLTRLINWGCSCCKHPFLENFFQNRIFDPKQLTPIFWHQNCLFRKKCNIHSKYIKFSAYFPTTKSCYRHVHHVLIHFFLFGLELDNAKWPLSSFCKICILTRHCLSPTINQSDFSCTTENNANEGGLKKVIPDLVSVEVFVLEAIFYDVKF